MFLRIGDITTHVQIDGAKDAPPLLLIHSLGTTGGIWEPQAHALAGQFRCIRPDLRGHGLTEVTPGPYSIEGLARDMFGLLDALGIEAAFVGGVSIGGAIAQAMATLAPARVRGLILADTAMNFGPPQGWLDRAAAARRDGLALPAATVLERWVTAPFRSDPTAIGLRNMLLRTDPEGYAGAAEALARADQTETTPKLRHPTLVLVGDHDQATPPSCAEALAAAIPGARLVVLQEAAHIPTVQQPDAVIAAMTAFLLAWPDLRQE